MTLISLTNKIFSGKPVLLVLVCRMFTMAGVMAQSISDSDISQDFFYCQDDKLFRVVNSTEFRRVLFRSVNSTDTLSYSARLQGGITDFDASNPFKILVFSAPFQKIYYLNHRLAPLSEECLLSDLGLGEVTCACASKQGGFWVFDRWNGVLVRFDGQFQRISSSENFSLLGLQQAEPVKIREVGNQLYVCCRESGGYRFDLFGNYIGPDSAMRPEDF